jgi:hypothetical protein
MSDEDMIEDSQIDADEEKISPMRKLGFIPSIARTLTEEDIKSPAFFKMVLSDNDKSEKEINELRQFKDKYYISDKKLAVAEEKLKRKTSIEIFADIIYEE